MREDNVDGSRPGERPATIRIQDVKKIYRMDGVEVAALKGVTLSIEQGEFVSIMGTSGSGKSTLMHITGCLDRPSEGTIYLDGIDVSELHDNSLADIRNKKIGFIFQSFNLLARTSAITNVELPLLYAGVPRSERRRRAREALERVGLGQRLDHFPSQLSGGEQQRVAIARALINHPSLVLADEPTGNLDSRSGAEVMRMLGELHEQGITLIMVTHDRQVAEHADRIIHIKDGLIVGDERVGRKAIKEHQAVTESSPAPETSDETGMAAGDGGKSKPAVEARTVPAGQVATAESTLAKKPAPAKKAPAKKPASAGKAALAKKAASAGGSGAEKGEAGGESGEA